MNLFKKKLKLNRLFEILFDTHFIPLQNEPSPILVGPKLRRRYILSAGKHDFTGESFT